MFVVYNQPLFIEFKSHVYMIFALTLLKDRLNIKLFSKGFYKYKSFLCMGIHFKIQPI